MKRKKHYNGYPKPVPENCKVVSFRNENKELRFCIIDADTGVVFDDAQGYGYKTAQNAHIALAYKRRSKEEFEKERKIENAVKNFCESHKAFEQDIDDALLIAAKDGIPLTEKEIESWIPDEIKEEMWFGTKKYLKYR